MNLQEMLEIYDFNDWVNQRLLTMAANVTPEQIYAPSAHSFSSLHATPGGIDFSIFLNEREAAQV